MRPIYFPYTYVSKQAAEALAACFRQIIIYRPSAKNLPAEMQQWVQEGIFEIRIPVSEDTKKLEAVRKDFQGWANLHHDTQRIKTASSRTQEAPIPFFNETAPSHIIADIKKNLRNKPAQNESDPLLAARVFLDFAQELDRQSYEIDQDLAECEQKEQELIKNLRGEEGILADKYDSVAKIKTHDPGEYIALGRLEAWTHLMQRDKVLSGLFVTSSQSVFTHLLAKAATAEKIFHSDIIPALENNNVKIEQWRDHLMKYLVVLAENNWPVSKDAFMEAPANIRPDPKVTLTLYLVPDQMPHEFFTQCVHTKFSDANEAIQAKRFKNTLIGLVEF